LTPIEQKERPWQEYVSISLEAILETREGIRIVCAILHLTWSCSLSVRFIALLAMAKITPTHPQMVAEYQEEILQSLDDSDVSIRMRALELVTSMVSWSSPFVELI
jgi:hypothetical protein